MAWIEVHDTLPDHPKVLRAAKALKLDSDALVGKLVRLWVWALGNREDGVLNDLDADRLDVIMQYRGKASALLEALVTNRLLDALPDEHYMIHDWDEHVMMLRDKREEKRKQNAERVKRYRNAKKRMESENCNADVTHECNADVTHYNGVTCNASNARTVPNRTIDDLNDDPTTLAVCARETAPLPVDNFEDQVRETISEGFLRLTGREANPVELDALVANTGADGGMSPEMVLLAVSRAVTYGAKSIVGYSTRVMVEWRRKGLFSPAAVDEWEVARDGV